MSARKNDRGKDSRDEDERKGNKTAKSKDGNPSQTEIDDLSKLIRKHSSQSTGGGRRKRSESSCEDSDSMESRFKTPPAKKKRDTSPSAPKKEKEAVAHNNTSDGSGDEVHRRSKKFLETETRNRSKTRRKTETTAAVKKEKKDAVESDGFSEESGDDERKMSTDQLDSETVKDLRKVIANQKKKLRGTLKSQTIKICSDLDKKNKFLTKENETLYKVNEELKMSTNSGEDEKKTKYIQEKLLKVKEERNKAEEDNVGIKKNLERVRRQRNEAEDKAAKYKKEREALTKELREVRGEAKKEKDTFAKELREVKEDSKAKGKEIVNLKKLLEEFGGEDDEVDDIQDSAPKEEKVNKPATNEPVDLSSNTNDDKNSKGNTSGSSIAPAKETAAVETEPKETTAKEAAAVETEPKETTAGKPTQEATAGKPTKEASKAVAIPDEVIEEISSGEEWEGTTFFKIGHHLVKNIKNSKVPQSAVCSLTPVCTRRWVKDEEIAIVLIIDSTWHPENESEQWVCGHHHEASIRGNNLQMQKLCKAVSRNIQTKKAVSRSILTKKAPPTDPFKALEDFKIPRRESTESRAGKEGAPKGDAKENKK